MKLKGKPNKKKTSPGQMNLPWNTWEATDPEIQKVADKFVMANCYQPPGGSARYRKPGNLETS
ncbi:MULTISPECIES: hypothetical protein [Nostocaceae]|uniref:hypothetical protein n=1 Tax=Nostocaceae TaxID=1162 RepID=UPI0039C6F081